MWASIGPYNARFSLLTCQITLREFNHKHSGTKYSSGTESPTKYNDQNLAIRHEPKRSLQEQRVYSNYTCRCAFG
jgi:hypothetical protein